MAQVTIYLPDDLERDLKRAARSSRKSLSSFLAELAARELRPGKWPTDFMDLFGSWEGELQVPEDVPPEETPGL